MSDIITILLSATLTIFLCGIYLLRKYSDRNKSQQNLITLLVIWLISGIFVLSRVIIYSEYNEFSLRVLDIGSLIRAVFQYVPLILFMVISIDGRRTSRHAAIVAFIPLFTLIGIYFIWHAAHGIPYNYDYNSYAELWEARTSPTVILRGLITLTLVTHMMLTVRFVNSISPIYEKYALDHYADSSYNMNRLKITGYAIYAMFIGCIANIFANCSYTYIGYIFIVVGSFVVIIELSLKSKAFDNPLEYKFRWSFKRGWHATELSNSSINLIYSDQNSDEASKATPIFEQFESWLKEYKPYHNSDFSMKMVEDHLSKEASIEILRVLRGRGLTFQHYIRGVRIEEAAQIIIKEEEVSFSRVAERVGFGYGSSFTRAFIGSMDCTPTEFRSRYWSED